MIDAYGNFYPDYPGQLDPRFSRPMQVPPAAWQAPPPPQQPQPASPAPGTQAQSGSAGPQPVRGEIIPVPSITGTEKYYVAPGKTMFFMTEDEQTFIVKEASANGAGFTLGIYDRRPPAPPEPSFDPRAYLTREETAALIDDRLSAFQTSFQRQPVHSMQPAPRRVPVEQREERNEPV